jgi:hypothetical protein
MKKDLAEHAAEKGWADAGHFLFWPWADKAARDRHAAEQEKLIEASAWDFMRKGELSAKGAFHYLSAYRRGFAARRQNPHGKLEVIVRG